MSIITLNNNQTLDVLQINGSKRFYQNANRDTLEFVFNETQSMDNLAVMFSEKMNTRTIKINQEGSEYVYNDYVIQLSVSRETIVIAQETSEAPEQTAIRIKVVMAQQTYTEKLIEQLLGAR